MTLDPIESNAAAIELGLCARDLASTEVISAASNELAVDVRRWMSANEFDVVPLDGRFDRIVTLESLADCLPHATAATYAQSPPRDSVQASSLAMIDSIHLLRERPWFLVADEDKLSGIVTRTDLARPAATIFAFALIVPLERMLRRLLGSYSNTPIPDEPPKRPDTFSTNPLNDDEDQIDDPGLYDLASVLKEVGKQERLRHDLGFSSRKKYKNIQNALVVLRTNAAHSRRFYFFADREDEVEAGIDQLLAVYEFARQVISLVNDREQIWDAKSESRIRYLAGSEYLALTGNHAVADFPFSSPVYVITAANPFEQVLTDEDNRRRNEALEAILQSKAARVTPAVRESIDGSWSEASFLVEDLDEAILLSLGIRFGQRGLLRITAREQQVLDVQGTQMRAAPRIDSRNRKDAGRG